MRRETVKESVRKRRGQVEKREKDVERRREARRKKKMRDQLLIEELLHLKEKVQEQKKYIRQLEGILQVPSADQEFPQEIIEDIKDQPVEEFEKEEEEVEGAWTKFEGITNVYLSNPKAIKDLTSLDEAELHALHDEFKMSIEMTTNRAGARKSIFSKKYIPTLSFLFMTLLWLRYYPPIRFLSNMFQIHERTCTKVLKQTIVALSRQMEGEIKFPSDNEMSSLMYTYAQNDGFATSVCVADGTEIQISRPSKRPFQRRTWSGKKHQHALNMMIITKLNGEIIYFSPLRVGAHDQAHWNELQLRNWFIGKPYGILGDGGFSFNPDPTQPAINGKQPIRKPRKGVLTNEQKRYNHKLAEMRVVVENSIRAIKSFKIMSTVFRHWRYGQGQIDGNDILRVCVCLANRRIKKNPLRGPDWKASHWREVFRAVST